MRNFEIDNGEMNNFKDQIISVNKLDWNDLEEAKSMLRIRNNLDLDVILATGI